MASKPRKPSRAARSFVRTAMWDAVMAVARVTQFSEQIRVNSADCAPPSDMCVCQQLSQTGRALPIHWPPTRRKNLAGPRALRWGNSGTLVLRHQDAARASGVRQVCAWLTDRLAFSCGVQL
jgi:hypothetical protein